jgi:protein TonB
MSLILDALRKLEREKHSPDPAVVVVGAVPWGGAERRRRRLVLGTVAALVALGAVGGLWWRRSPPAEPIATPSAPVAAPTAPATPTAEGAVPLAPPPASPAPPVPTPGMAAAGSVGGGTAVAAPQPRSLDLPAAAEAPPPPEDVSPPAATAPPAPPPKLQLNAISVRDGHPVALLNDHLVREGDSFDGVKVIRIGETEVEVEIDGKRRVIRF